MAVIAPVPQVSRATTRATTTTTTAYRQSPSVTVGQPNSLQCSLITADEPACQSYAWVTIVGRGPPVSSSRCHWAWREHRRSWPTERSKETYRTFSPSAQPLA